MALSIFTGIVLIGERSEATPGLWNTIFSTLSANLDTLNSDKSQVAVIGSIGTTQSVVGFSSNTLRPETSNNTIVILPSASGGPISLLAQRVPSYTSTYNALWFGSTLSSKESRIQNAMNQAAADNIGLVWIPTVFQPFSASSITFNTGVKLAREGGDPLYWDIRAYGAAGDSVTDDTNAIAAAYNGAIANGGTIYQSAGTYKITATLPAITKPTVSIVGDGSGVVKLVPTSAVTADCLRIQMSPFVVTQAGSIGGFTLDGTSSGTSSTGIHAGDVIGLEFADLVVQNFTGTGAIGINLDNITNWTERTSFQRVHLNNNTISLQFNSTAGGATQSFGYTKLLDLRTNVNPGQIGIQTATNAFIYSAIIFVMSNVSGAGTVWNATGASQTLNSLFWLAAEQTSGSGATFINVASGARVSGHGHISNYGASGGGNPMALVNANAAGQGATLRIVPIGAQASNWQGVQDSGAITNFGGSGNAGTVLPAIFNQEALLLAALGTIYGTGIESPFASFYNATGNGFVVLRVNFGQALNAATEVFRIDTGGNAKIFGGVYPADGTSAAPSYTFSSESALGLYRSGVSHIGLSYGGFAAPSGTALLPPYTFSSESSLGAFRSGVSTLALSYGTFNLADQAVRLSMRTIAASALTASAANTNVAVNEAVFTVQASGASFVINSGGTSWIFNSVASAKNT